MCMNHWELLRAAVAERGLAALIADSGEQAAGNLRSELTDGPTVDNFDPLMGAHNAIVGNALGIAGLALMFPNEDGTERCPICFLNEAHTAQCQDASCTADFDSWIARAADDMVTAWRQIGDH